MVVTGRTRNAFVGELARGFESHRLRQQFFKFVCQGVNVNTFWSKTIQSTELLDTSRQEKFNGHNRKLWFHLLQVRDNLKILEVGCGSGHFINMIKLYHPSCDVYGIDLDDEHIRFAKEKSKRLKIDVHYQVADVKHLPFDDNSFDLVFSHTLVEHLPFDDFVQEQKRVLKDGGKLIVMRVDMGKNNDKPFTYLEDEINALYAGIPSPKNARVGQYVEDPDITMQRLDQYQFKNINFNYNRIIYYMPDALGNKKEAISQIERNYQTKLAYAMFVIDRSKVGSKTRKRLLDLLKRQYEERLKLLRSNKKIFDYQSSALITISARK